MRQRARTSESKMGCRYIQLRWQASHSEVTSCTSRSCRSQPTIRSSKGALKAEKENCCVSTMWSSNAVLTSSESLITPADAGQGEGARKATCGQTTPVSECKG